MSNNTKQTNPLHQYDTRFKPIVPQRTNANVFWQANNYTPNYTPTNTTKVTTYSPLYFTNGRIVPKQEWWGGK